MAQRHDAAQATELGTRGTADRWMLLTFTLALIAVGGMSFPIGRSISKAIVAMVRSMKRLASGDVTIEIPGVGRRDEIGEMAGAVQVFKTNMIEADAACGAGRNRARRRSSARPK